MKIDGGCHCGLVRYEAEVDRASVTICHCSDCQTLSGSAFRTLAFSRKGTFRLLAGTTKVYLRTGGSGVQRELHFCGECGSPISSTTIGDGPKVHAIRVGTVRQRGDLSPRTQIWFGSAQAWVTEIGSIPSAAAEGHVDALPYAD